MCFSAEASFTVGSILGIIGIFTLKQTKTHAHLLIALFPLLFAFQQMLEGFIWLHMEGKTFILTPLSELAVNLYLFFAWLFWPVFVPISFFLAETIPWKQIAFAAAFFIGACMTYVNFLILTSTPAIPVLEEQSLNYGFTPLYGNLIYGMATFIPIFISSIPRMWILGATLLITFIISQLIYAYTFTSVWCFFCAISSMLLWKILRDAEKNPKRSS